MDLPASFSSLKIPSWFSGHCTFIPRSVSNQELSVGSPKKRYEGPSYWGLVSHSNHSSLAKMLDMQSATQDKPNAANKRL